MDEQREGFMKKYGKIVLIIGGIVILLVLFTLFSGKAVSPDLVYFPT